MTIWNPKIDLGSERPYLAIVGALAADIESGSLEEGQRLPTHRELADALDLAVGTVTRAYKEAEHRGLVRGEVGRGTFVGKAPGNVFSVLPAESSRSGVIDLSLNYPIYSEEPDLAAALARLGRRSDVAQLLRYQPHAGMPRHRAAGAAWAERFGIRVDPNSVIVCNGAQHALTVALSTLTQPGDVVLTEALTYPGMKAVANLLHLRLQGLAMDAEGLLPDAFAAACRQRHAKVLYCMPTLHNPMSGVLSESRRREIAAIAVAHDVAVVEDDVHRSLVPDPPPAIASMIPEQSYFIAGFSKSVAGGLRIGYLTAPPHMIDRLCQNVWATCWVVAPLTAEIASMWIEDGTADETLERKRTEAAARQEFAREVLGECTFRAHPNGFHIWLELPPTWTSAEFAMEARRRGVAVTPAEAFAVGGEVPRAVRVCLGGTDDRERLRTGLEKVVSTLHCCCGVGPTIV